MQMSIWEDQKQGLGWPREQVGSHSTRTQVPRWPQRPTLFMKGLGGGRRAGERESEQGEGSENEETVPSEPQSTLASSE